MPTAAMPPALRQLVSFALVGIVNTGLSLAVIWTALWLGINPYWANAIGYAVGLTNSFLLNRAVTFRKEKTRPGAPRRFLLAFLIAYLCNLIVLSAGLAINSTHAFLWQIPAMVCYTLVFFILSKWFVFR